MTCMMRKLGHNPEIKDFQQEMYFNRQQHQKISEEKAMLVEVEIQIINNH